MHKCPKSRRRVKQQRAGLLLSRARLLLYQNQNLVCLVGAMPYSGITSASAEVLEFSPPSSSPFASFPPISNFAFHIRDACCRSNRQSRGNRRCTSFVWRQMRSTASKEKPAVNRASRLWGLLLTCRSKSRPSSSQTDSFCDNEQASISTSKTAVSCHKKKRLQCGKKFMQLHYYRSGMHSTSALIVQLSICMP